MIEPSPADENPFASRYVRPGVLAYDFAARTSAATLVDRFLATGRRAQIVGRHGSGKSTLLAELADELRARGVHVALVELHDGCRDLPVDADPPAEGVLLVDGYEQLGRLARWRLGLRLRRRKTGLLVTVHQPRALPTLYTTEVGPELAVALAERRLAASEAPQRIAADEVRALFAAEQGNMREVFFRLYDLYESRRSRKA